MTDVTCVRETAIEDIDRRGSDGPGIASGLPPTRDESRAMLSEIQPSSGQCGPSLEKRSIGKKIVT
ncbi:hypothetical protein H351_32370 (plasmid) [Rhodococcus erythropolis R138]|nr:hypothetical protein H351_32370 [Rhodococcus erythropolis R138]